jgi:hypothetical protein
MSGTLKGINVSHNSEEASAQSGTSIDGIWLSLVHKGETTRLHSSSHRQAVYSRDRRNMYASQQITVGDGIAVPRKKRKYRRIANTPDTETHLDSKKGLVKRRDPLGT